MSKFSQRQHSSINEIPNMFDDNKNLPKYQFVKIDVPHSLLKRFEQTFPENEDVSNIVNKLRNNSHIVNINNTKDNSTNYSLLPIQTEQEGDEYIEKTCKELPKKDRELLKVERTVITKYFPQHKDMLLAKIMDRAKSSLKMSHTIDNRHTQKLSHNVSTSRKTTANTYKIARPLTFRVVPQVGVTRQLKIFKSI